MGRRFIIVGVLVACIVAFSSIAFATDIPAATVKQVGPYGSSIKVMVSGAPLSGDTQFILLPSKEDEQLAVILTALSLDKTVWMRTVADTPGSYVTVVYVNQ